MIVVLVGYMASGKSSIGMKLAQKLNYNFIDLDHYIEEKESTSIPDIFKTKGEIYFRKKEALALNKILDTNQNIVLALGGGTPCYAGNMDKLIGGEHIESIYLKASINTIIERLENEKDKRPLISHIETNELLFEFIGKHLFERTQFYNLSNTTITTDEKSIDEIIESILLNLF